MELMVAILPSGVFVSPEEEHPATTSNMTSSIVISLDFIFACLLNEILIILNSLQIVKISGPKIIWGNTLHHMSIYT